MLPHASEHCRVPSGRFVNLRCAQQISLHGSICVAQHEFTLKTRVKVMHSPRPRFLLAHCKKRSSSPYKFEGEKCILQVKIDKRNHLPSHPQLVLTIIRVLEYRQHMATAVILVPRWLWASPAPIYPLKTSW